MKPKHHLLFQIYYPGHIIGYISEPVSAALSVFELPSTLAPTLEIHYPPPAQLVRPSDALQFPGSC